MDTGGDPSSGFGYGFGSHCFFMYLCAWLPLLSLPLQLVILHLAF